MNSEPFANELDSTSTQKSGLLQNPLGVVFWSDRLHEPLVLPGLVGLVILETSAGFDGECLWELEKFLREAGGCPVDDDAFWI